MKKILLKNLHIINPCSDHALVDNAYVAIYGDTIESVSSGEPAGEFDAVHDLVCTMCYNKTTSMFYMS